MSSFQQVVMGGICLVAAFWFGSYINEQPATVPSAANLVDQSLMATDYAQATMSSQSSPSSNVVSTLMDTPAAPRPVTLDQLKTRSSGGGDLDGNVAEVNFEEDRGNRSAFVQNEVSTELPRSSGTFAGHDQQRIAIVPDFSELVAEVNRVKQSTQSARQRGLPSPADYGQASDVLLPVPQGRDFSASATDLHPPQRDWNAVRAGVLSVEEKLSQFRHSHPTPEEFKPVPPMNLANRENAVAEAQEFETNPNGWNLQPQPFAGGGRGRTDGAVPMPQENPLRGGSQLTQHMVARVQQNQGTDSNYRDSAQPAFESQQLPDTRETLAERRKRWDMFGDRTSGEVNRTAQRETRYTQRLHRRAGDQDSGGWGQANESAPQYADRPSRVQRPARIAERSGPATAQSGINRSIGARVRALNQDFDYTSDTSNNYDTRHQGRQDTADRGDQWQRSAPINRQNNSQIENQPQQGFANGSAPRSTSRDDEPEIVRYSNFKSYVTQSNDTLQTISESFYGTPEFYFDLYLANRDVLTNPATVRPGTRLKIPEMDR